MPWWAAKPDLGPGKAGSRALGADSPTRCEAGSGCNAVATVDRIGAAIDHVVQALARGAAAQDRLVAADGVHFPAGPEQLLGRGGTRYAVVSIASTMRSDQLIGHRGLSDDDG